MFGIALIVTFAIIVGVLAANRLLQSRRRRKSGNYTALCGIPSDNLPVLGMGSPPTSGSRTDGRQLIAGTATFTSASIDWQPWRRYARRGARGFQLRWDDVVSYDCRRIKSVVHADELLLHLRDGSVVQINVTDPRDLPSILEGLTRGRPGSR
jgi:hypothetical protein